MSSENVLVKLLKIVVKDEPDQNTALFLMSFKETRHFEQFIEQYHCKVKTSHNADASKQLLHFRTKEIDIEFEVMGPQLCAFRVPSRYLSVTEHNGKSLAIDPTVLSVLTRYLNRKLNELDNVWNGKFHTEIRFTYRKANNFSQMTQPVMTIPRRPKSKAQNENRQKILSKYLQKATGTQSRPVQSTVATSAANPPKTTSQGLTNQTKRVKTYAPYLSALAEAASDALKTKHTETVTQDRLPREKSLFMGFKAN